MSDPAADPRQTPQLAALVELARTSVQEPSRSDLERGLAAVRARLATAQERHRRLRWVMAAAAVVVLPLALLVGQRWLSHDSQAPLTYRVEGGNVLEGGYLQASTTAGVALVFSEGSRFTFEAGTRGRLRSLDGSGARVGLEKGAAHFDVTPDRGLRWVVEVGPFAVTVKGTSFGVWWDPASERFELDLEHGEVAVTGPVANGELSLRSGQRLVVDLTKADTLITKGRSQLVSESEHPTTDIPSTSAHTVGSGAPTAASSGVGLSPASSKHGTTSSPAETRLQATTSGRNWANAMARGRWRVVIEDVERAGVEVVLSTASSEDLVMVADAARYSRHAKLARQALLAQRTRFPASRRAHEAAFLLGRVEESQGNQAQALDWYERYQSQNPNGSYAAEALIRKMTIVSKSSGKASARPIAQEYLKRFPQGKHAGSARALLNEP
jgi:TolA-binding protein